MHLTAASDCIGLVASQTTWNKLRPTLIDGCRTLALKRDALPESHLLIRPRHLEHVVLIRRQLADELLDRRFSGLRFMYPEDYTSANYLGHRCYRAPT